MRKVTAEGGTIVRPRMPVMGYGWLAYCQRPEAQLVVWDDAAGFRSQVAGKRLFEGQNKLRRE